MARNNISCDVCGKPCQRIVAKLFVAPVDPGRTSKTHSEYTGHADVGECCAKRIVTGGIKWQKRKKHRRKPKVTT